MDSQTSLRKLKGRKCEMSRHHDVTPYRVDATQTIEQFLHDLFILVVMPVSSSSIAAAIIV
jgi:hypothetical protein